MVFVNVISFIQSTLFSATFFIHNLIKNNMGWDCVFYTVTIVLDLNIFYQNAVSVQNMMLLISTGISSLLKVHFSQ